MGTESQYPNIKVTLGKVSVEYCGDQAFIEDGLLRFVESMIEASGNLPETLTTDDGPSGAVHVPPQTANVQHMSTNTIASQIGAKSGPDLVMAAVTHLQLVQGKEKVHRTDIASEMKGATTYYKTTFTSNLSSYLDGLVKAKRLNLVGEKTYALTAAERQKMEPALAAA